LVALAWTSAAVAQTPQAEQDASSQQVDEIAISFFGPEVLPRDDLEAEASGEIFPNLLDTTLSVEGDMAPDGPRTSRLRRDTLLEPWFAWKQGFQQRTGLAISGSYGVLWQNYSSSLVDEEDAVGGKFTLNLAQTLLNRGQPNALTLDVAIEDRRPLGTEFAPLQAGLRSGSAVPPAATWGEFDLGITQFYLRQNLDNNRYQYAIGKLFAPNFVNAYPFFDDNRQFLNLGFSTSPTIPVPLRGFGMVGAAFPTRNLYLKGGMFTPYSDDTGWTVDSFFEENEYFYFFEFGLSGLAATGTPVQARGPMDRNNFHITSWYRDELNDGTPRAYGFAFNANSMVGDNVMWFFRGGWADGSLADLNFSGGVGWRPTTAPSDLFGFGLGWARPTSNLLDAQGTAEIFYRYHITENFAMTPDLQVVFNPSLDPSRDSLVVFSLRGRVTF
jgi:hypothetical protein